MKEAKKYFKNFWNFLKKDSWASLIVTLIIAFIVIKFLLFPFLSFITGTTLPLVIVESCSMYHSNSLEDVIQNPVYSDLGISFQDALSWPFKRGMTKGDVIFVIGVDKEDIKIGDVIIFKPNPESTSPHPIIHRVVSLNPLSTKGDHNSKQLKIDNNPQRTDETSISEDQLIGKSVFRVPLVGWVKLIFYEFSRPKADRGFCS